MTKSSGMRLGLSSTLVGTALFFASCSPPAIPSLEDADFEVTPASADDWARYEKAMEPVYRAQFAGATYMDARGGIKAEFKAKDYDAYLAYERSRSEPNREHRMPLWPVLKMKLHTHHVLYDSKSSRTQIGFEFCDSNASKNASWGILNDFLLWRGQLVDRDRAAEISRAIQSDARAQEYEVFLTYVYYAERSIDSSKTVTLLPLPSDLCVALVRPSGFESFDYGPPKRLDKALINRAVGVLPRLQSIQ